MARDAGDRAPDADVWVAGADDTRIEVRWWTGPPTAIPTCTFSATPKPVYSPVGADYAAIEAIPITASPEMQTRAALTTCTLTVVEQAGGGTLMFSWIDALGEDGYEIYRGDMDTVTWTTPDDQETGQPSYYYLIVPRRGTAAWKGQPWADTVRAIVDGAIYAPLTGLTFRLLWPAA